MLALDLDIAAAGRLLQHASGDDPEATQVVFGEPATRGTRVKMDQF